MKPRNPSDNRIISLTIRSADDSIILSSNYDEDDKKYYMPGLSLKDGLHVDEYWDNTSYLFGELLEQLNTNSIDIYAGCPYPRSIHDDFVEKFLSMRREELIDILEKGKELGWHKL